MQVAFLLGNHIILTLDSVVTPQSTIIGTLSGIHAIKWFNPQIITNVSLWLDLKVIIKDYIPSS